MDTLGAYIKMCDCPEIQGEWKPQVCDWAYDIQDEEPLAFPITLIMATVPPLSDCYKDHIWLPRQDQLQEMVYRDSLLDLLVRFKNFIELDKQPSYAANFKSMEQLWLAFAMRERFGKVWSGTEWVNEDAKE